MASGWRWWPACETPSVAPALFLFPGPRPLPCPGPPAWWLGCSELGAHLSIVQKLAVQDSAQGSDADGRHPGLGGCAGQ